MRCLLFHREFKPAHDLAQSLQRLIGAAFTAQDHAVAGVIHDARAGTMPPRRLTRASVAIACISVTWIATALSEQQFVASHLAAIEIAARRTEQVLSACDIDFDSIPQ
jgi:hypothetical protein